MADDDVSKRLDMSLDDIVASGGSGGGNSKVLAGLAKKLGVNGTEIAFLRDFPLHVQESIAANFDSTGTKDGNLIGRLEAYARGVARKMGVKLPTSFARPIRSAASLETEGGVPKPSAALTNYVRKLELGEGDEKDLVLDLISTLAEDMQVEIMKNFDSAGTKDGNVWRRLFSYIRSLWLRRLVVDPETSEFIKDLDEEVQIEVIMRFDPTGTKDGHFSARLHRFATLCSANASRAGKTSSRESRGAAPPVGAGRGQGPLALPPSSTRIKRRSGGWSDIPRFRRQWDLDDDAVELLEALPQEVLHQVITGFDGSNTRDGDVVARFLGYVRLHWSKHYELDEECLFALKRLPPEGQFIIFTEFDPTGCRDGNVAARLRGYLKKVEVQMERELGDSVGSASWYQAPPTRTSSGGSASSRQPDRATRNAIRNFVRQQELDDSCRSLLESVHDPDVLATVLEEFDPRGTKDGNMLGRLKAYVTLVSNQSRRGELSAGSRRKDDYDYDYDYEDWGHGRSDRSGRYPPQRRKERGSEQRGAKGGSYARDYNDWWEGSRKRSDRSYDSYGSQDRGKRLRSDWY
eukprot:TRINITY_DN2754_c0_g4_i1.p1 TRINITY_DN2754_c0_g4~~TRINITY_DN2754_c0_g4_i1.p1  ORF type:complete len:576 (-),score=75.56 TRINITY_DN2754_c0_g4_i1:93-1820(-)